jgi:hypothetical protein
VRDEKSRLPRPEKELVAFEKVFLDAGETKHLRISLDKHAVGYYDTSLRAWIAEEGVFRILIGASSADIRFVPNVSSSCCHQSSHADNYEQGKRFPSKSKNRLHGSFSLSLVSGDGSSH